MGIVNHFADARSATLIVDFCNRAADEVASLDTVPAVLATPDAKDLPHVLKAQKRAGGFTLLAVLERGKKRGGNLVVGVLTVDVTVLPDDTREAGIAVAVERTYRSKGVAAQLMQQAMRSIADDQTIGVATLTVMPFDAYGKRLKDCFGFWREGTNGTRWQRTFARAQAQEGKALFYLGDLLDAFDFADDETHHYACLQTGEVDWYRDGEDLWDDTVDSFDPEEAEGTWEALPDRHDLNEWQVMHDFALFLDDPLSDRLLDIIHRRGAYRNFKDECGRHGHICEYYAFRETRYRARAIDWLEAHDCVWTEGWRPVR